jgi:hypothetical protein
VWERGWIVARERRRSKEETQTSKLKLQISNPKIARLPEGFEVWRLKFGFLV